MGVASWNVRFMSGRCLLFTLASMVGLRMLGLFLILPVFAIYAKTLPGGDNATAVGWAK